jgi:hypothetical protein
MISTRAKLKVALFFNFFVFAILLNSVGTAILQVQRNFNVSTAQAGTLVPLVPSFATTKLPFRRRGCELCVCQDIRLCDRGLSHTGPARARQSYELSRAGLYGGRVRGLFCLWSFL